MGLLFRLTWRTIAARPTLAVLAVLLLAMTTAMLYGLIVSASVVKTLRESLISELAVEIELADYSDSTRFVFAETLRQRSDVLSVKSLSARDVLEEAEQELGESLRDVLSDNPFPPILRVQLRNPMPERIELFIDEVAAWPGVLQAVYPRDLWRKFDKWMAALRGRVAVIVGLIALIGWALVGLSLRAILRNRRSAWQLLSMLGIKPRDLEVLQLNIELVLGLFAGAFAVGIIYLGLVAAGWLLLRPIEAPTGWIPGCLAMAILLSVLAGIWAPRPSKES